jgi:MoaA/NifB/PqqE/SkfB family radical SAM enzyme
MKENKKISGLDFTQEEVDQAIKNNQLLSFDLEFSRACNLKCRYCYAGGRALPNELSLDEIKDVIDQAVTLGAKNVVNIGGGEPLLYKHYWEILNYEREKGLKTITFTNGTLITKEIAKKLFDLNENIALKYNSSNESVQDYLAQKEGTGKLIKCALNNLLEVGYTKEGGPSLALETVITKQNYSEIEDLYKSWRKQNILPYIEILTEQGLAVENDLGINPKKGKELFEKLLDFDQKEYGITWPLTPPIVGQTCKRMLYSAYIRSDGNVQPCPGVEIVNSESNIRNNKLKWILDNSPVFKDVRNIFENIKGRCKTCVFKNCYGCRGTALFQNKGYLEEDCTCWYLCDN